MVTVTLELDDQCPSFRATLRQAVRVLLDRARELERSNRVPGSQAWDDEDAKLDAEESEQLAEYLRCFIRAAHVRSGITSAVHPVVLRSGATVVIRRCEGWRRNGGAFTVGPVKWAQCEEEATVLIAAKQDGETKAFPACRTCWEEAIDRGIEIVSVRPIRAVSAG